jgi:hypothetical protein
VGTVFITDVLGSWLQVIGRRAFGKLWVSGYAIQAKDQDTPAVALSAEMPGIEVVRGPEAEQLIELVEEDRGEQSKRQQFGCTVQTAGKPVPLHHCFIEGQKKSPADAGLVVRREHG